MPDESKRRKSLDDAIDGADNASPPPKKAPKKEPIDPNETDLDRRLREIRERHARQRAAQSTDSAN